MNKKYALFFCLLALAFPYFASAQVGCEYKLELYDSFGDGWNGGFLTITINGKSENYTFADDFFLAYPVSVSEGDSLSLSFTPGFFPFEASYRLFDAEGIALFSSGSNPASGLSFSIVVDCPECPNLSGNGLAIDQVRHNRARIRWTVNDPEGQYILKAGPAGTSPGELAAIQLSKTSQYQLDGLEENSLYDIYLQAICSNGDTTNTIGPFSFRTLWARDVGMAALVAPRSDCDLPADESISVILKNFGGAPQTLIPFNYSVNGIPGNVNQPNDGLFTGILSFDSTSFVNFDAPYDFSEPATYLVKVWTELEGDQNPDNDTLITTVVHTPLITNFPYSENFESGPAGWMVDNTSEASTLELGKPTGLSINSASSGQNAWVTKLSGDYNHDERSILVSPCFDFSSLTEDPDLSFSLWIATEPTYDGAWVEVAVAGGDWEKLGSAGNSGSFWYNLVDDVYGDWWSGENIFGGWRKVRHPLTGLAGEEEVRIRIIFQSDEAVSREGIGVDDVFIAPPLQVNLAAVGADYIGDTDCGSEETMIQFHFRNEGAAAQDAFQVAYQVNDGPVIKEDISSELQPEEDGSYIFEATFNSTLPDIYRISAWTEISGEQYPANDTAILILSTAGPGIPFLENFESGELPGNWTLDSDLMVENGHFSGSYVLFDNLWENDTSMQATTPILGPLAAGDSLYFGYRFVNFSGLGFIPAVLGPRDALRVEISEDCGLSFNEVLVIDAGNHPVKNTLQEIRLPLDDYAGQWIKIRFRAGWGTGDYYIDLDNINVRRCPGSLNLEASVVQPTGANSDGSIRIAGEGGLTPYLYRWSNGSTQGSVSGLGPGAYQITVSDQQGCTDQISVNLEAVVGSRDRSAVINSIKLIPNPSSGRSLLNVELENTHEIDLTIFDARGSLIKHIAGGKTSQMNQPIDLEGYPDGLYFIRVRVQNDLKTIRMLKANRP